MTFWINQSQPEKFCVTKGSKALMITQKPDEFKIITKKLDSNHAANIKARYTPAEIEQFPIINSIVQLLPY